MASQAALSAEQTFDKLYERLPPDLFSWFLGTLRILQNSLNVRCARPAAR